MIVESELIKKAKKGQAESFGALYDKYAKQIYRFTLLKVSSQEEAEDITHDVFISAWQNIGNYEERGFPFSSWLYQIARNRIIDYYRNNKVKLADLETIEDIVVADVNLPDNLDLQLNFESVKLALRQLSQEQQDIIIMRYVEDLPYEEIAKIFDKSEGAVRLIQHRAIQALKQIILQNNGQVS